MGGDGGTWEMVVLSPLFSFLLFLSPSPRGGGGGGGPHVSSGISASVRPTEGPSVVVEAAKV